MSLSEKMRRSNLLSIIIVNYRSEKYLQKCLGSIFSKSDPDHIEIIVVNNDPRADLDRSRKEFESVMFYDAGKNKGFGAACNEGVKKAAGEIILFLNPDTQFTTDYAKDVLDGFMQHEKTGIIGPRLVTDEGKTQKWCAGKTVTLRQVLKNKLGLIENKKIWESQKEIFTDWVSGAALAIRKEVFEKIGGFDEKFFTYFEDDDLCLRAREAGYAVMYDPKLSIVHSGGKSHRSKFKQKIRYFKALFYFLKKKAAKTNQ